MSPSVSLSQPCYTHGVDETCRVARFGMQSPGDYKELEQNKVKDASLERLPLRCGEAALALGPLTAGSRWRSRTGETSGIAVVRCWLSSVPGALPPPWPPSNTLSLLWIREEGLWGKLLPVSSSRVQARTPFPRPAADFLSFQSLAAVGSKQGQA